MGLTGSAARSLGVASAYAAASAYAVASADSSGDGKTAGNVIVNTRNVRADAANGNHHGEDYQSQ